MENRSVYGIHENSSTELTLLSRKKGILRGAHLLIGLLSLTLSSTVIADILRCKGKSGQVIFTDNVELCLGQTQEKVTLRPSNEYVTLVDTKLRIKTNFRVPKRFYQQADSNWKIFMETSLLGNDPLLAENLQKRLEQDLNTIFSKLPTEAAERLKSLSFYLLRGEKHTEEKPLNGLYYVSENAAKHVPSFDPRWGHSVVILSAHIFMELDEVWTKKALMHEIAHAWHLTNWPADYPPIVAAYENAKQQGLYRNIKDYKGKSIPKAYALKNQLEYFADLSAMYFVGGNYHPFNQEGLSRYDNVGLQLVSSLWGY